MSEQDTWEKYNEDYKRLSDFASKHANDCAYDCHSSWESMTARRLALEKIDEENRLISIVEPSSDLKERYELASQSN